MRRIGFVSALVALLAAGLAAVAMGANSGSAARVASHRTVARTPVGGQAQVAAGSTCFVAVPYCSETPCVEYAGATASSAVYVLPGNTRARRANRCPEAAPRSRAVPARSQGAALPATWARTAHRLSSRGP